MEWQPIETAPKVEDILILCWDGNCMSGGESFPFAICEWNGSEWTVFHEGNNDAWSHYLPTHWMPLPEPPNDKPVTII